MTAKQLYITAVVEQIIYLPNSRRVIYNHQLIPPAVRRLRNRKDL